MKDGVQTAFDTALKNDIVLLSPACASFDMYESYVQRGEVLIIVLSILILVWLVYVMVSRFMLRPLEKLEEGVERISRENYSRGFVRD